MRVDSIDVQVSMSEMNIEGSIILYVNRDPLEAQGHLNKSQDLIAKESQMNCHRHNLRRKINQSNVISKYVRGW